MNSQEIDEMEKIVAKYDDFDANGVLRFYPLEHLDIAANYRWDDIGNIINGLAKRFARSIESGYIKYIPATYKNEKVVTYLDHLYSSLYSHSLSGVEGIINYLIDYQVAYGLLSLQIYQDADSQRENLNIVIEDYNKLSKNLRKLSIDINKSVSQFEEQVKAIDEYRTAKARDLDGIDSLVHTARKQVDEINDIAKKSINYYSETEVLFARTDERSNSLTKKLEESQRDFQGLFIASTELKRNLDGLVSKTSEHNNTFEDLLLHVTEKSVTFDEKLSKLNELLGKEAAKQLFNTFNVRKNELRTPVKYWIFAVYGVSILSLFLIVAISTNGFGYFGPVVPKELDWKYFLSVFTRSVPVVIIFYFTIRQYNRERTFMEEYAFRSAIALTIQAYADLAGDRKAELIMNAVTNIYAAPKSMRESSSLFGFSSRHVPETLKEIKETLNTLASAKKD